MDKAKLSVVIRENGVKKSLEALIEFAAKYEKAAQASESEWIYLRRLRVDLEVALLNYEARYALGFDQKSQERLKDETVGELTIPRPWRREDT